MPLLFLHFLNNFIEHSNESNINNIKTHRKLTKFSLDSAIVVH